MFVSDFGNQINRYANLVDLKGNQFEVLIERINNKHAVGPQHVIFEGSI
jgi:tRNA(Glu) U13 pseudouridine synthase TruD